MGVTVWYEDRLPQFVAIFRQRFWIRRPPHYPLVRGVSGHRHRALALPPALTRELHYDSPQVLLTTFLSLS